LFGHTISPDWVCAQGLTGMGGQSAGTTAPTLWPPLAEAVRVIRCPEDFGELAPLIEMGGEWADLG
jgi:hypothetical protein